MDSLGTETRHDTSIPADASRGGLAAEGAINLGTLFSYLAGRREAILRVANSRLAIWFGLAFVILAGFAREYDGEDLWHEPWHLALPLVASLGTSFVLYLIIYFAAYRRGVSGLDFVSGYRTLLTFYWWTAPLAWLYAIPVERFMSAGDATAANLGFLAVVSVWRVLLMTRVLAVWLNAGLISMFFLVVFFADSVALVLAYSVPKPIFNIMGGIRMSEPDAIFLDATMNVMFFGTLSWIIWFFAASVVLGRTEPQWSLAAPVPPQSNRACASLWAFAALLLVVGVGLLSIGQPEQQRRWQVESFLHADQPDEAAKYAAQFTRDDFPPIWDPPPRIGYGEKEPPTLDVLVAIERQNGPEWLQSIYVEKISRDAHDKLRSAVPWDDDGDWTEFEGLLTVCEKHVPAETLSSSDRDSLRSIASHEKISEALSKRLKAYLGEKAAE